MTPEQKLQVSEAARLIGALHEKLGDEVLDALWKELDGHVDLTGYMEVSGWKKSGISDEVLDAAAKHAEEKRFEPGDSVRIRFSAKETGWAEYLGGGKYKLLNRPLVPGFDWGDTVVPHGDRLILVARSAECGS